MNNSVKKAMERLYGLFPLKNIIVFESLPDFSDNPRAVFDEMLRRGMNEEYQLVWTTHGAPELPQELQGIKNVTSVHMDSAKYKYYYSYFTRAFAVGNYFMQRRRREQYYIFLAHGAAFKGISDHRYTVPEDCRGCDFAVYSDYLGYYDIRNLGADETTVHPVPLGYARNDALFHADINVHDAFGKYAFEQLIYWMPTFRQKKSGEGIKEYSSIAVPFLHDRETAQKLNACAAECHTLLVLKPHPAQDIDFIKEWNLSHISIIDNDYLVKNGITNYELLGASDALLTDYSSVYYDYLLCDKPIGLCWEDYEEYRRTEGFTLDPQEIMAGGERLYTVEDACRFIRSVADGVDALQSERHRIRDLVFLHSDDQSAARTVDYIMKQIKNA